MGVVLVVDDEKSLRDLLTIMLENEGYEVKTAASGESAVRLVRETDFDLVLTDIRMKRSNGIDVLETVREVQPETPVVMMTAFASADTAVEAMKKGAYDYISKPFKVDDLKLIVKNAVEKKKLAQENIYLKSILKEQFQFANIVGKSSAMVKVFDVIRKVAQGNVTVLISGESGTGKELVAKAIHYHSPRKHYPFVSINCGAMPESLLESELFGHEKGAFTSADAPKAGLLETANRGSFFLDEVGEAPLSIQVKLLRVLQEKEFTRIGGTQTTRVDARIIAASNHNLSQAVKNKTFREDLFYRLNVVPIHLPPLRERREDIPLLVDHFFNKYNEEHQHKPRIRGFHPEAFRLLEQYHWPGNVRELANAVERAVVLETEGVIRPSSLPEEIVSGKENIVELIPSLDGQHPIALEKTLDQIEKRMIEGALEKTDGIIHKAAEMLDLSFRSMRYRIQKHKLKGKPGPPK